MLLYVGARVGVVVLVLVLVLVLGGSSPPAKQGARKPDDASSRTKPVRPVNTDTSATTTRAGTSGGTKAPDEPPPHPPRFLPACLPKRRNRE